MKLLRIFIVIIAILYLSVPNGEAEEFDHSHTAYDKLLQDSVKDGLVNYKAIKVDSEVLNGYLDTLGKVDESTFNKWPKNERLTYLINLYNAATIKLIVDNYPVKSIRDINKEGEGPWKLDVVNLLGKKVSLDALEHEVIRNNYNEPRIHFALVCAAYGCPKLPNWAFVPSKLEQQLHARTKLYLSDKSINYIDEGNKTIYLSSIFNWFSDDFIKTHGTVLDFVKKYLPTGDANKLSSDYPIKFTEYDWSLNDGSK